MIEMLNGLRNDEDMHITLEYKEKYDSYLLAGKKEIRGTVYNSSVLISECDLQGVEKHNYYNSKISESFEAIVMAFVRKEKQCQTLT